MTLAKCVMEQAKKEKESCGEILTINKLCSGRRKRLKNVFKVALVLKEQRCDFFSVGKVCSNRPKCIFFNSKFSFF